MTKADEMAVVAALVMATVSVVAAFVSICVLLA